MPVPMPQPQTSELTPLTFSDNLYPTTAMSPTLDSMSPTQEISTATSTNLAAPVNYNTEHNTQITYPILAYVFVSPR